MSENTTGKKIKKLRKPVAWLLSFFLVVLVAALVIYIIDLNYSDAFLFFLLIVLKFSAYFICLCSVYMIAVNTYRFFREPSLVPVLRVLFYLFFIAFAAGIIFYESFITVIAAGNG